MPGRPPVSGRAAAAGAGLGAARTTLVVALAVISVVNVLYLASTIRAGNGPRLMGVVGDEHDGTPVGQHRSAIFLRHSANKLKEGLALLYCDDTSAGCPDRARRGQCSGSLETVFDQCKKSCSACDVVAQSLGSSLRVNVSLASVRKLDDPTGGCSDNVDACAAWADMGRCTDVHVGRRHWVTSLCRKSCGTCVEGGGNGGEHAGGGRSASAAAALGHTEHTHKLQQQHVAAGAVASAAEEIPFQYGLDANGSARAALYHAATRPCADRSHECEGWAKAGQCKTNPSFMLGQCMASCNVTTCAKLLHLPQPLAKVRLNNGVLMPTVGYGCAALGDMTADTVALALKAGYRHLDSAQAREWYREDLVGQGLAASGVPRGEVFITSKLHPRHLGADVTRKQFNQTLRDLNTTYIDLFLLHYPECWGSLCELRPKGTWQDSWRVLEELYDAGLARAIGVSNFDAQQMEQLLSVARVRPQVLQAHSDPLSQSKELMALCRQHGIQMVAYSTLGTQHQGSGNPVLNSAALKRIAQEVRVADRGAAAVALRWALQAGLVVLPRSSNEGRIAQNLRLFDFELSDAHMLEIDDMAPS